MSGAYAPNVNVRVCVHYICLNLEGWMTPTHTRLYPVTPRDGNLQHKKKQYKKRSTLQNLSQRWHQGSIFTVIWSFQMTTTDLTQTIKIPPKGILWTSKVLLNYKIYSKILAWFYHVHYACVLKVLHRI